MTTLMHLAHRLASLRSELAEVEIKEWQAVHDLEVLKVAAMPPAGWPGSNEAQRKAAEAHAYLDNAEITNAEDDVAIAREKAHLLKAEIAAVEDERRAAEWEIRKRLADALLSRDNHAPDVEFDAATTDALVNSLT